MTARLRQIADTMALDGYTLVVEPSGRDYVATVTAHDGVCGDCLVPKPVMTNLLATALEVGAERIDVRYPADLEESRLG